MIRLTTTLLALDCPLILAPAMNDRMYRNPVVRNNIDFLKQQGVRFVEPGTGQLACGTVGAGQAGRHRRDPPAKSSSALPAGDLTGLKVLVTAGPTREQIDRRPFYQQSFHRENGFCPCRSCTGTGSRRRARVRPNSHQTPDGITVITVISAADMSRAVMERGIQADIVIMAAAVSDFRPQVTFHRKIKKEEAPTSLNWSGQTTS